MKNIFSNWVKKAHAPTKAEQEHAGQGILRKDGTRSTPQFVTLFHHTVSETTAVYVILSLVAALFLATFFVGLLTQALRDIAYGHYNGNIEVTLVVFAIELLLICGLIAGFSVLVHKMLHTQTKRRLQVCESMIILLAFVIMCHLMVFGINLALLFYGLIAALLIALHSYWDPELALERANRKTEHETLHEMLHGSKDEQTVIPGKKTHKGYITLDFFNLFWVFLICSVIGLVVETIYFYATHGWYMDRAGMLWGPFSPIYGFGGTLMTIFLNRFHSKNVVLIFLVSAVIGGTFEYFTSWFMQTAFGITAWDYSGTFLNIDGRTNFFYMCCWGLLGVLWIKRLLPFMLYFIKKIPWSWRYTLTTICAILYIFDGVFTLITIDCWYLRESHVPETTAIEKFCAKHFDDSYMQNRFQTMTMHVSDNTRAQALGSKAAD